MLFTRILSDSLEKKPYRGWSFQIEDAELYIKTTNGQSYLQYNECILHGQIVRRKSLSLPSQLLTFCAHEPSEVKSLKPCCFAPFGHSGLSHVFWGTTQVSDKSCSYLSPPGQLFQLSGQFVDLRGRGKSESTWLYSYYSHGERSLGQ